MVKLHIITHSGDETFVEVESYNALEMAQNINNHEDGHVIAIGDEVFAKIDIKRIKVVETE